eukprot:CAMPEP_0204622076 /NCGR_PEP_ID=MMETSP0717-20131115/7737_1 /ASSEMBLY_ACC=CAM_ASM_000666 /TAXON_ID=230516 /ORGANISM="Chaetoceros curvisetus" /LENGTH=251 /DNA_ID=CAMNT_0051636687 /DNA_START=67 /DNA_END=822 /DNA_ORIENTATION=-
MSSYAVPNTERVSTIPCNENKDFSTQVACLGEAYRNITSTHSTHGHLHTSVCPESNFPPGRFGVEMSIEQANAAAMSGAFDKILLLLEHGEADYATSRDGTVDDDLSLTKKGYGQALSVSGETAVYCYEGENSALSPDLFVVPPLRCAIESLLVAFPYYTPDSIHTKKWICHGSCMDHDTHSMSAETLETIFPGIDVNEHSDKSDFLTWLGTRKERVIAVSSTPSWVRSFCGSSTMEGKSSRSLRAVGIKL